MSSDDYKRGTKAEVEFEIAIRKIEKLKGCTITEPKIDRHIYDEHWDRYISHDIAKFYVDVKSMRMAHDAHKNGYTWLEIQNVKGDDGSINDKKLEQPRFIAFEKEDHFDLINVIPLLKYVEEKFNITNLRTWRKYKLGLEKPILTNFVDDLSYMEHRIYARRGDACRDLIILTAYKDIDKFICKTIYK